MTDPHQASLFDLDNDETVDLDADETAPDRLLFVTNRYNLLEFISAGLILPSPAIDKYYDDLLAVAPGYLPLFADAVPADVVELMSAEASAAFPVILEVEGAAVTVPSPSSTAPPEFASAPSLMAASAPVAMSAVIGIHFRSEIDLAEHTARSYRNVPDFAPLTVNPQLFRAANGLDATHSALRSLDPLDTTSVCSLLKEVDRLAGLRLVQDSTRDLEASGDDLFLAELSSDPGGAFDQSDRRFVRTIVAATVELGPGDDWLPRDLLNKLAVEADHSRTRSLSAIEAALRNERPFEDVLDDLEGPERALLGALLRPDVDRVAGLVDQLGEGSTAMAISLVGWMTGFKRLVKPNGTFDYRLVDDALAQLTAI